MSEANKPTLTQIEEPTILDLLERAWGLIANVNNGDWDQQTLLWKRCAEEWRNAYFRKGSMQLILVETWATGTPAKECLLLMPISDIIRDGFEKTLEVYKSKRLDVMNTLGGAAECVKMKLLYLEEAQ